MSNYETSATVEEHGRILVAGVPFATGTKVDVSISPKDDTGSARLASARERMKELFRTTKGYRNTPRMTREELHERGSLR